MDPLTLGISAVGLGMQVFGAFGQADASEELAALSKKEAAHEQNINALKVQQMQTEARRSQLQSYRNTQRARAMGIAAAVNQGASKGSGMQGGIFDVQNQGLFNVLGVNQGLEIGNKISKENDAISQLKMQMADVKGQAAEAQGWSSLGGSLMKSAGVFGSFGNTLGGLFNSPSNPYYGPLDYNGPE